MQNKFKTFIDRASALVKAQLSQGANPRGIAKTIAVGSVIATIPIIGVTTALCVFFGIRLKLNQPIIQLVNYLLYPVQILLLPVFLKAGALLFSAKDILMSPSAMIELFKADPGGFLKQFGIAGLQATVVWAIAAPFIYFSIYGVTYFILKRSFKAPPHDSK